MNGSIMERDMFITQGSIIVYRLFDLAWEIDLAAVERKAEGARRLSIDRKRFSKAFQFANPPVTTSLGQSSIEIGRSRREVRRHARIYDYGVLAITIEIDASGISIQDYAALAREAAESTAINDEIESMRQGAMETFRDALKGDSVPGVVEDYTIYYLRSIEGQPPSGSLLKEREIAGLLLMEDGVPSRGTVNELEANSFSYLEDDLVVVNWDNALVVEPSGSMDIPDLLEFANSYLLEMRVYDKMLDAELNRIYDDMGTSRTLSVWKLRRYSGLAAKMMMTVNEFTEIVEKIENSLKVTDDVYYAKVYSATLALFRLESWSRSVRQKIEVATRSYDMLCNAISTKRSEWLEIIIILLIALEIVFFALE